MNKKHLKKFIFYLQSFRYITIHDNLKLTHLIKNQREGCAEFTRRTSRERCASRFQHILSGYRLAAKEIEAGETHKGAWLLALDQANGDTNLQQAEYMKIRVQMMLEKEGSAIAQKITNPAIVQSSQKLNEDPDQPAQVGVVIFVVGIGLSFFSMTVDSAFLTVIGGLMAFVGGMTWGLSK